MPQPAASQKTSLVFIEGQTVYTCSKSSSNTFNQTTVNVLHINMEALGTHNHNFILKKATQLCDYFTQYTVHCFANDIFNRIWVVFTGVNANFPILIRSYDPATCIHRYIKNTCLESHRRRLSSLDCDESQKR